MTKGRKPAEPAARLQLLRAAREKVEDDDILNAREMAAVLGMTQNNLMQTLAADAEFPVEFKGGEGIPYRFKASAVLDHMIAKCEAAIAERQTRDARVQRLSGLATVRPADGPAPGQGGAPEALSPGDLRTIGEAQMIAHKLKLAQGQLVEAAPFVAFMLDYHSQMQAQTLFLLGKIDPAGQWPAGVRASVEEGMRTLLVQLQEKMDRFVTQYRDRRAA